MLDSERKGAFVSPALLNSNAICQFVEHLSKSTPFGSVEGPINPIALALAAGGTFVARAFRGDQKHLTDLIKQGLQHKGFSFIDIFSPCVT